MESEKLRVTLLGSEWSSSKGGLSTINRELAIQLAKHPNVDVSVYLPSCSDEDRRAASSHNVQLIEAQESPGFDQPIDWLVSLPNGHYPHCVIGHGVHLGRQIPHIQSSNLASGSRLFTQLQKNLECSKVMKKPFSEVRRNIM